MTKKTGPIGQDSGGRSSDRWLSPRNPQTGDGRTTRSLITAANGVVLRNADGSRRTVLGFLRMRPGKKT